MNLTQEDIVEIIKLFEESKFDLCHLETGDLKLTLSNESHLPMRPPVTIPMIRAEPASPPSAATPAAPALPPPLAAAAPGGVAQQPAGAEEGLVAVTAPVIGTFYEAPEPGARRFVDAGASVEEDTTVGLIEVMKVFTAVKAGMRGRVERILVGNGQFVEFGQSLLLLRQD